MPLDATRRSGLVDQVIAQLRTAVTTGEWELGQRIPPESELAETLDVGRNTVREAVRALSHSGLLDVRQGDGTYVLATSEVSGAVRRLFGSELRETLVVRRALEVEGARLAATQRTEEELAELSRLLDIRERAQRELDFETFVRVDTDFHTAVVHAGHNELLDQLYRDLTEVVTASVMTTSSSAQDWTHDIEHRGLLEAIAANDTDRAVREASGFLDELLGRVTAE